MSRPVEQLSSQVEVAEITEPTVVPAVESLRTLSAPQKRRFEAFRFATVDAIALSLALVVGAVLSWGINDGLQGLANAYDRFASFDPRLLLYFGATAVSLVWFHGLGHYTRRKPFWAQLGEVLRVLFSLAVLEAAVLFLVKLDFSRAWFLVSWALAMGFVPAARYIYIGMRDRAGQWKVPAVILGCGPNAIEAAAALKDEPFLGAEVIGFLATSSDEVPSSGVVELNDRCVPVTRVNDDPARVLRLFGNPKVVVALESGGLNMYQGLVKRLSRDFRNVTIVPALRGLPLYGMEITHFFRQEVLLLNIRNNLARRRAMVVKRLFDMVAASALLVTTFPVALYLASQVRKDGGPVFFGHTRVGRNGKPFTCYKFRTMVPNAQDVLNRLLEDDPKLRADWERDFKLKEDPRVTPVGRFLRKSSLDELPQLWNVLKGEMSLVGPRPVVRDELSRYDDDAEYYLEVRPGITGLWQVSGRNDVEYDSRVQLDTWYVRNWSLWHDVVILLQTVRVVLTRSGAY